MIMNLYIYIEHIHLLLYEFTKNVKMNFNLGQREYYYRVKLKIEDKKMNKAAGGR